MEAAQQSLIALDKGEPLEGEDETDVFLRKYGIGRDSEEVIKRYEEAMSAFDDVPTMVRKHFTMCSHFVVENYMNTSMQQFSS